MSYKTSTMEKEENKVGKDPEMENVGDVKAHYDAMFRSRVSHNKALMGIFIVIIGIIWLLKEIPSIRDFIPNWLFTWPMIFIVLGAFIFLKNGFGGLVPILIGVFFLLWEENILSEQIRNYAIPLFIILIGIMFILKRNHHPKFRKGHLRRRFRGRGNLDRECMVSNWDYCDKSSEDYLDVNSVFGNTEKSMFTKSFKGGNINCAFGGAKINLSQADLEEKVVLNVSVAFGGAEITVPANWHVQNDLTAILGGIEDVRRMAIEDDNKKTLILRGGIFCGGVEIKN